MSSLNDSQRTRLLAQLDEREAQLRAEVLDAGRERDDAANVADPLGNVEDFGERGEHRLRAEMQHAERERDTEELQAIEEARARLEDGNFGECIECGTDIPLARLEVQPWSARCLRCQQKFEQTHPVGPRILQTP